MSIRDIIKDYKVFGDVDVTSFKKSNINRLYQIYKKNLVLSRSVFLMEMFSSKYSKRKETAREINQIILMKPKLSDIKYPLMFNQKVSNVISSIYNNIDVFAEIVSNYFKEKKNEDDLGIFCFLTFPSVFGSLINDKFCELACDFASKIFTLDGKSKLADALFESFWLESHDFNYFFWNEIRKYSNQINHKSTFDDIFKKTKECIISTLPHLSNYNSLILKNYCNSSIQCYSHFIDAVFITPILRESSYDIYLSSSEFINIYHSFLKELQNGSRNSYVEELVNLFVKPHSFINMHPKHYNDFYSQGIQVLLNDYDIMILYKMLKNSNVISFGYKGKDLCFSVCFESQLFQVHPSFEEKEQEHDIGKYLFGKFKGKKFTELNENEVFQRKWKQIQHNKEYIINHVFINKEFEDYCLCKILQSYKMSYQNIENVILLYEHCNEQKKIFKLIKSHHDSLYYYTVYPFYQAMYFQYKNLKDMIASIVGYVQVSPKIAFDLSCVAMDTFNYYPSSEMILAQKKFINLLNKWMEDVWISQQDKCKFLNRIKYISEASTLLNKLNELKIGQKLRLILDFIKRLKIIIGENSSEWNLIFSYTVFIAQSNHLLPSFLALQHYIFSENDIVKCWSQSVYNNWGMFTSGILSIISNDKEFCSKCFDPEYYKTLFD